jgi:hypothetical protein
MGRDLRCPQCNAILDADSPGAEPPVACPQCGHRFGVGGDTPSPAAAAPVGETALRFETAPYRPDGGFGMIGSGILIGLSMLAAVAVGWVVSFIGQWFYLILLFPLLIGGIVGVVGIGAITLGKVRSPWMAGLAGFLAGCVAMLSVQYFDYLRFRAELDTIPADERAQIAALTPEQLNREIAQLPPDRRADARDLWRQVRINNLFGFIDFRAEKGVTIQHGRGGAHDRGMNLGYVGSYIYWTVELLIVAVLAFFIMQGAAARPFCPECNEWKQARKLGTLTFRAGDAGGAQLLAALGSGEVARLVDYSPSAGEGPLHLTAAVCPKCGGGGPVDVKLQHRYKTAKNEEKTQDLLHVTYPGEALPALEAIFRVEPPVLPEAGPAPGPDAEK